jgi:hypothetical protein
VQVALAEENTSIRARVWFGVCCGVAGRGWKRFIFEDANQSRLGSGKNDRAGVGFEATAVDC